MAFDCLAAVGDERMQAHPSFPAMKCKTFALTWQSFTDDAPWRLLTFISCWFSLGLSSYA